MLDKVSVGNEAVKRYIQKAFGYALSGDISEQVMFLLYGTGSNGKSTMLNIFSALLDGYAQSTSSDTFMQKKNESVNNDIARLKGARFVSAIEMEEGKRMAESLINRKLGSDMADSVTGGGLHGKDLSKADVSVNIYAWLKAQEYGVPVELCCAIGDDTIDGRPYSEIVRIAREYIRAIGGFESFAEWGLV